MQNIIVNRWLTPEIGEKSDIVSIGCEYFLWPNQGFDGPWKLAHMADLPVRFELREGNVGVPERDSDDRNTGTTGDTDIRSGIPDHDRGRDVTARARNRLLQDGGIGFGD